MSSKSAASTKSLKEEEDDDEHDEDDGVIHIKSESEDEVKEKKEEEEEEEEKEEKDDDDDDDEEVKEMKSDNENDEEEEGEEEGETGSGASGQTGFLSARSKDESDYHSARSILGASESTEDIVMINSDDDELSRKSKRKRGRKELEPRERDHKRKRSKKRHKEKRSKRSRSKGKKRKLRSSRSTTLGRYPEEMDLISDESDICESQTAGLRKHGKERKRHRHHKSSTSARRKSSRSHSHRHSRVRSTTGYDADGRSSRSHRSSRLHRHSKSHRSHRRDKSPRIRRHSSRLTAATSDTVNLVEDEDEPCAAPSTTFSTRFSTPLEARGSGSPKDQPAEGPLADTQDGMEGLTVTDVLVYCQKSVSKVLFKYSDGLVATWGKTLPGKTWKEHHFDLNHREYIKEIRGHAKSLVSRSNKVCESITFVTSLERRFKYKGTEAKSSKDVPMSERFQFRGLPVLGLNLVQVDDRFHFKGVLTSPGAFQRREHADEKREKNETEKRPEGVSNAMSAPSGYVRTKRGRPPRASSAFSKFNHSDNPFGSSSQNKVKKGLRYEIVAKRRPTEEQLRYFF